MSEIRFSTTQSEPVTLTEDHVMSVLLVRRARDQLLADNLFSDPAWDILLELFAAHLGGRKMAASDLAVAIEVPCSTTSRWVATLEQRGLVDSLICEEVRQLALSDEGVSRMERLAGRWATAFLAIA